jgi:hypothetical protein
MAPRSNVGGGAGSAGRPGRRRHRLPWAAALFSAPLLAAGHEPPPALKASALLPAALQSGPRFKVADDVRSDGYMTAFDVQSDFGAFPAPSREMLEVRVREVAALIKLEDVSKSEVFAKSLGAAAEKKGKALANVAMNPVETAKGVPQGVGRFFKGVGAKGKKAAGDVKEDMSDKDKDKGKSEGQPKDDKSGGEAEQAAKDVSGMSKARREWARKLDVDPYTTNPALSKKLDDIGWAAYAGGFAVALAPVGTAVSMATKANDLVWQMPPADLAKRNDEKLKAMGVTDATRKAFLKSKFFTPTLQTEMVVALEELGTAKGREEAVALAARETDSEEDARFYRRNAQMLAQYHQKVAPVTAVQARKRLFIGRTASGALVFPAAVDYLTWTPEVDAVSAEPGLKSSKRDLWLSGRASDTAKKELTARGWTVKESALQP